MIYVWGNDFFHDDKMYTKLSKNFTIKEMAYESDISPNSYLYIEQGENGILLKIFLSICAAFNGSIFDILNLDSSKLFYFRND